MDDPDICHGHYVYAMCSRVSVVIYSMVFLMMSTSNLNRGFVSNHTTICVNTCGLDHFHKHEKTSLVETLLRLCRVHIRHDMTQSWRGKNGLTFTSKVTSMTWKHHMINIVDTPGHNQFIGEVRQSVSMADGAILVVDVNKGLGQVKFVAEAIRSELNIILVLRKVDRCEASALVERLGHIKTQVWDVLVENDSIEVKLDFPVLYAKDMSELLEAIIEHVPAPTTTRLQERFKMMVTSMSWKHHIINIVNTPGHDQFGEVRQGVSMADGNIILVLNKVDRFEASALKQPHHHICVNTCGSDYLHKAALSSQYVYING